MTRKRFQFSLSTLLLSFTIACMTLSLFLMYKELRETRQENQGYRDRHGYLEVDDPEMIHAIQIPTNDDSHAWQWRVYIPKSPKYKLCYQVGEIPPEDKYPSRCHQSGMGLSPGECTIHAGVTRDIKGKRVFRVKVVGQISRAQMTDLEGAWGNWLDKMSGFATQKVGSGGTSSSEPGKPMSLLRVRNVNTCPCPQVPLADGFLVWIEEADAKQPSSNNSPQTP